MPKLLGTPFPYIGSVRGLAPFIFAIAALLWLQRRGQILFSAGSGLGEADQSVYGGLRHQRSTRSHAADRDRALPPRSLLPLLVPEIANAYWLKTLTSVVILALASLCVGVIYAQLGMVSLCQFALVGVGGWFALRLYHATHLPFEFSILAGGVSAAIFGLVFGLPALRMRGLYLALDDVDDRRRFPSRDQRYRIPGRRAGHHRKDGQRPALLDGPAVARAQRS